MNKIKWEVGVDSHVFKAASCFYQYIFSIGHNVVGSKMEPGTINWHFLSAESIAIASSALYEASSVYGFDDGNIMGSFKCSCYTKHIMLWNGCQLGAKAW